MSKHKKNEFQGMEHLQQEREKAALAESADARQLAEHKLLKKELFLATGIMLVIFIALIGLAVYDAQSPAITDLAQRITESFTN